MQIVINGLGSLMQLLFNIIMNSKDFNEVLWCELIVKKMLAYIAVWFGFKFHFRSGLLQNACCLQKNVSLYL